MSYCLNPACPNPNNPFHSELCQACGSKLLLRDRYRSIQALGKGGFGATFLAEDEALPGRPACVIKQLRPVASAPQVLQIARELFAREATILGKIGNHPQIPRLLDYFELNQEFYLVQEHVHGLTLQQEVKRSGAFDEASAKKVLSEVLSILDYVHSQGVIHRDIKPANLIRRSIDDKIVLIDFGAVKDQVSQTVIANSTDDSPFTAFAVGTSGYAPPEQMALRPIYASDLYALGVTGVYLLTGKSPKELGYDADGELNWQNRLNISDRFAKVIKKMLEVSLRHRYQTAKEVLRTLELEPHIDSLAQGMVAHRGAVGGRASDQPYSTGMGSPAARAAVAVRAQQAKSEMTGPHFRGTRGTRGDSPGTHLSTGSKGKLTANSLQAAYSRGKRDFTHQDLSSLQLPRVNLSEAVFSQANLQNTDLRGANLFQVNLSRASLTGVILRDAKLGQAYLSYADLEGADLRGADLSHAYLSNANLRGANLGGADLTGATLTHEQLAMARTSWTTVFPKGKRGRW